MAKKAEVINVTFNDDNTATVTYSTGTIRPYKSISNLPKTALDWLGNHKEPETIETVETATTETETTTATAEEPDRIPVTITDNQMNGFDFWYDTNLQKFIILYCGDEIVFDSVADAWEFSKEMRKAEEDAETGETEEPEQPETEMEAAEEPETITTEEPAKVGHITAVEPEQVEESERKEPAAIVPIIGKPETATAPKRYTPASEAVMFGLCMFLAYAWFFLRGAAELLIIMIQNVWSHRTEYAEKVHAIFREEIKPAAILAGFLAKDTATTAASWTVETAKEFAITASIIVFTIWIYSK